MDYKIFATGPHGEEIYSDFSGKCYYLNKRGVYEALQYSKYVDHGNVGSKKIDITTKNFSTAGAFYINGNMIMPKECSYANLTTHVSSSGAENGGSVRRYPSSSIGDVGGYATNAYNSVLEIKSMASTIEDYFSSQKNGQSSSIDIFDFTIDSEIQDDLSSKLKEAADVFEQKVTLMYREIGNMANYWVGEDYDAYCQATDGYKNALGDLSDSIRMYGKHFKEMSDSTEDLTNQLIEIVETCTSRHVK